MRDCNKKPRVMEFLKRVERPSTGEVSKGIKSNQPRANALLEELRKEGKVKRIKETNATYWKIIKKKRGVGV